MVTGVRRGVAAVACVLALLAGCTGTGGQAQPASTAEVAGTSATSSPVTTTSALGQLTTTGFGVVSVGMSAAEFEAAGGPKVARTGTETVSWIDCILEFTDGVLTEIRPTAAISTVAGLQVGDPVSRALELYGTEGLPTDAGGGVVLDGRGEVILPSPGEAGTGYRIGYDPATQLITGISLCLCQTDAELAAVASATTDEPEPAAGTRIITVNPLTATEPFPTQTLDNIDGCSGTGDGTYRCGSTADSLAACWPTGDDVMAELICMISPTDTSGYLIHPTGRLYEADPDVEVTDLWPWMLELADGSICQVRLGGAWDTRLDDYNPAYWCEGPSVYVLSPPQAPLLDRSSDAWTVFVGDADGGPQPPPTTIGVVTAWIPTINRGDLPN